MRGCLKDFDFFQQGVKVAPGEFPLERLGDLFVIALEAHQAPLKFFQRLEVIGRKGFALEDGKIYFDLIKPACVDRAVHKDQVGIARLQAGYGFGTSMCAAVIDDPEDSPGALVGLLVHDLSKEPIKWRNAIFSFTTAKEFGTMDIEGGQVSPDPAPYIFTFHLHGRAGLSRVGGVRTAQRLDAGLLIGRQHELVVPQGASIPDPSIKVKDAPGFFGELGIAGEDPRSMLPRSNRILMEPAPYGAIADGRHKATLPSLSGHIGRTPAGKRHLMGRRQLAGQGLNLNDQIRGEKPGGDRAGDALQGLEDVLQRSVFATC